MNQEPHGGSALHQGDPPAARLVDKLPRPSVSSRVLDDGSLLLRSRLPVVPSPGSIVALVDTAAKTWPDRAFLRARDMGGSWQSLTFADLQRQSRSVAQWLLDLGVTPGDIVGILTGASFAHAVLAIATMRIQAAVASINPRFALPTATTRLEHCLALLQPVLLMSDDEALPQRVAALGRSIPVVTPVGAGTATIPFAQALTCTPGGRLAELEQGILPEQVARVVFTSGSSGPPKAVPQTHRMLASAVAQNQSTGLLSFTATAPRFLDALPWHHIFGSNHNFNMALHSGTTISLDDGQPTAARFGRTLQNLREVRPSYIATTPLVLTMLCDALARDEDLRHTILPELDYILFGGAGLHPDVVTRLHDLAVATAGREIPVLGSYGSSEMQLTACVHWPTTRSDLMGVPVPGVDFKLTPVGSKLEIRVRGPSVMPRSGYIGNAPATARAFDDQGFYRTGDAAVLAEPGRPEAGLVFDGRLAEEFKLGSGTWVSAGTLCQLVMAAIGDLVQDVVVCGPDADELGLLVWAKTAAGPTDKPAFRDRLAAGIRHHNRLRPGLSMRIARLRIMQVPLSTTSEEITDKATVNMTRVWQTRAADIAGLYASAADGADIMILS